MCQRKLERGKMCPDGLYAREGQIYIEGFELFNHHTFCTSWQLVVAAVFPPRLHPPGPWPNLEGYIINWPLGQILDSWSSHSRPSTLSRSGLKKCHNLRQDSIYVLLIILQT